MVKTISARQLTRMQGQVEGFLPDTCVIQSHAGTVDSGGRSKQTWTAVAGGTVACRVDPFGQAQTLLSQVDNAREQTELRYQLTVPYDAPLAENLQVVHGGKTYQIMELKIDHSWKVSKRAIMVRRV